MVLMEIFLSAMHGTKYLIFASTSYRSSPLKTLRLAILERQSESESAYSRHILQLVDIVIRTAFFKASLSRLRRRQAALLGICEICFLL